MRNGKLRSMQVMARLHPTKKSPIIRQQKNLRVGLRRRLKLLQPDILPVGTGLKQGMIIVIILRTLILVSRT